MEAATDNVVPACLDSSINPAGAKCRVPGSLATWKATTVAPAPVCQSRTSAFPNRTCLLANIWTLALQPRCLARGNLPMVKPRLAALHCLPTCLFLCPPPTCRCDSAVSIDRVSIPQTGSLLRLCSPVAGKKETCMQDASPCRHIHLGAQAGISHAYRCLSPTLSRGCGGEFWPLEYCPYLCFY